MMHYRSHKGRWTFTPMAAPPITRWQRLRVTLDDLFHPRPAPEGRRAIDPALPYGHWEAGWTETRPGQKQSR